MPVMMVFVSLYQTAILPPARQGKITYASYFTDAFISRPNVSIRAEPSANTIGSSLPHIALALFNLSELESGHAEVALRQIVPGFLPAGGAAGIVHVAGMNIMQLPA